eukprot:1722173-Amphidinium_carterae.1
MEDNQRGRGRGQQPKICIRGETTRYYSTLPPTLLLIYVVSMWMLCVDKSVVISPALFTDW